MRQNIRCDEESGKVFRIFEATKHSRTCGFVLLHQGCVLSCCTGRRGQQRARGHVASPNVPNPKMHVTTTFLNAPNDNLGPPAEANIIH
jgi:hypothetical protein